MGGGGNRKYKKLQQKKREKKEQEEKERERIFVQKKIKFSRKIVNGGDQLKKKNLISIGIY